MIQPIQLGQVIRTMPPSLRLLITEAGGREIYKGYVANLVHSSIEDSALVKEIGLSTEVFPKPKDKLPMRERIPVPAEMLTYFPFANMEVVVWQKIVIEK